MLINLAKKIVISRTDSIGDVALTLPLVGILKEIYPEANIIFLGNTYTKPIIDCVANIDEVWSWAEISKMEDRAQLEWLKSQNIDVFIHIFPRREIARLVRKAQIPERIGTSHRLFHLMTCNHRVNFTRKNSDLHEAQLNTKLLQPLGCRHHYSLSELADYINFSKVQPLAKDLKSHLSKTKKNIVLHPKSKGSALEWGVQNFIALACSLPKTDYQFFFTGTEEESTFFRSQLPKQNNITDLSGKMSLDQLISFIANSDLLVASSTGPLHIGGICHIHSIGLFTMRRPLHSGRWQPLGKSVHIINEACESERNQLLKIEVETVASKITEVL
ncbi:MAG: glycosyltransferase family 9 protein [Crocinitomicaceae bacterium]